MPRHIDSYSREEIKKCLIVAGFEGHIKGSKTETLRVLLSDIINQGDAPLIEDLEENQNDTPKV